MEIEGIYPHCSSYAIMILYFIFFPLYAQLACSTTIHSMRDPLQAQHSVPLGKPVTRDVTANM